MRPFICGNSCTSRMCDMRPGTNDSSNPGPLSSNTTAIYHTHGSGEPGYNNEIFSLADVMYSIGNRVNSYVGTPGGSTRFQNSTTGRFST